MLAPLVNDKTMATPELIASWARTESHLLTARAALPAEHAARFACQLEAFHELVSHNELGLALDTLLDIVEESNCTKTSVIRPLFDAAHTMGMTDRRDVLAAMLATGSD